MKRILTLLFLLPLLGAAQDCPLKKEVDQFSQEPKLTTGFVPFSSGIYRMLLSIDATKKEIDFLFSFSSSGEAPCFDDESTATFTFEGGRLKSNFKNTGSMNCEGLFHITFKNSTTTPSLLQRLATKTVVAIQLKGNRGKEINFLLKEADQPAFMNLISCMANGAKTLVQ